MYHSTDFFPGTEPDSWSAVLRGVRGCADGFSNIFRSDILECPSLLRRACSIGSRNKVLKLCHMSCYFSRHLA